MNKNELLQFYIDQWNSRKKSGMSHKKEDWDKRAVGWEKEITEEGERKARSERRVAETAAFLRKNGLLKSTDKVIDIGCGPGRFVAEFAKTAGHVTGTDISSNMCEYGLRFAHSNQLYNVDFVPCDFKDTDIKEIGWEQQFDLVFSSITPAMSSYDSFRKAERMSRAYCFQSNFVKVIDPLSEEVLSEVLGEDRIFHKGFMTSFLALFNILCLEGSYPIIRFFKEVSDTNELVSEHLADQLLKNVYSVERSEELTERIVEALKRRADADGKVHRYTEWNYGWILWDVREKSATI